MQTDDNTQLLSWGRSMTYSRFLTSAIFDFVYNVDDISRGTVSALAQSDRYQDMDDWAEDCILLQTARIVWPLAWEVGNSGTRPHSVGA